MPGEFYSQLFCLGTSPLAKQRDKVIHLLRVSLVISYQPSWHKVTHLAMKTHLSCLTPVPDVTDQLTPCSRSRPTRTSYLPPSCGSPWLSTPTGKRGPGGSGGDVPSPFLSSNSTVWGFGCPVREPGSVPSPSEELWGCTSSDTGSCFKPDQKVGGGCPSLVFARGD